MTFCWVEKVSQVRCFYHFLRKTLLFYRIFGLNYIEDVVFYTMGHFCPIIFSLRGGKST